MLAKSVWDKRDCLNRILTLELASGGRVCGMSDAMAMTEREAQKLLAHFGGTRRLVPYHYRCTYMLPRPAGLKLPDGLPQWWRERTHSCACSSWQLQPDQTWRVWRDGQWVEPERGQVRCKDVIDCDGDYTPIRDEHN